MGETQIKKSYYSKYFKREIVEIEYAGNVFKAPAKLNKRYKITGILASGGTGIIYIANDEKLFNKKVLIKTSKYKNILFEYKNDINREKTIKKQRKIITRERTAFLHSWYRDIVGIPTLLDAVVDINPNLYGPHIDSDSGEEFFIKQEEIVAKERYLVLSYIDGQVLTEPIKSKLNNPLGFSKAMLFSITKILREFHRTVNMKKLNARISMIYLDLKPENIIAVTGSGFVLIDLGSFSFIINNQDIETDLIKTPGYCAPELRHGANLDTIQATADVYSLGATVYEILTNDNPSVASLDEVYDFDFEKVKKYGSKWVDFLKKMLAYDKADRYSDFNEVLKNIPR